MKKLNFNIKNHIINENNYKKDIYDILDKNIKFQKLSFKEKIILSKPFLIFGFILSFLMIGIAFIYYRKKYWKEIIKRNTKEIIPFEIYKIILEKEFSNVKVAKGKGINKNDVLKYRGSKIPKDAVIYEYTEGPKINLENIELQTSWVNWRWTRSNGKSTQTYFYEKIYLKSDKISSKFNKLEFQMKKSHLFSKKGNDLENNEFNKSFWYDYNDGVKARMILPLSAQENWVNIKNDSSLKINSLEGMQINIFDGKFIFGKKSILKSSYGEITCKKIVNTRDKFINGIYSNVIQDVKEITSFLNLISINKYLIKK